MRSQNRGDTYVISDLHFGHRGICEFLKPDGGKVRPWDKTEEMDDELVKRFNDQVKEHDKCYILGDVVLNRRALPTIGRLNCKNLILLKGNHDVFRIDEYLHYFKDIRAYMEIDKLMFCHVPIHTSQFERWKGNVHGHLHHKQILNSDGTVDTRYYNVSAEVVNYTPISLSQVIDELRAK
jgi:calcineurin-like phosphoesterase family protein